MKRFDRYKQRHAFDVKEFMAAAGRVYQRMRKPRAVKPREIRREMKKR